MTPSQVSGMRRIEPITRVYLLDAVKDALDRSASGESRSPRSAASAAAGAARISTGERVRDAL